MKRTLIFAAIFALLAMIYVPAAMHTSGGGGGYRFIFDQRDTSVAFFQLLVNVLFASGLGTLLAQMPKRLLIAGAAVVLVFLVYIGFTSLVAMTQNDNANDLFAQRKYVEAAQAYHQAAVWWRAALRPHQADEDDANCAGSGYRAEEVVRKAIPREFMALP